MKEIIFTSEHEFNIFVLWNVESELLRVLIKNRDFPHSISSELNFIL